MLTPVVTEPLTVPGTDSRAKRLTAKPCVHRESSQRRRNVDSKSRRIHREIAQVEETVYVASEKQAAMSVMLAPNREAIEVAGLESRRWRGPSEGTHASEVLKQSPPEVALPHPHSNRRHLVSAGQLLGSSRYDSGPSELGMLVKRREKVVPTERSKTELRTRIHA
jgi:hypothetical protein